MGTGRLTAKEVEALDPYMLMAVLGKRVIHPGGKLSTEELFRRADFAAGQRVLDVGCGVGTTAIEVARRYDARVTAVDISPIMLERAWSNVAAAGLEDRVAVERGDILALRFPDDMFDRVIAEAVTMFVNRPRAAKELVRVCRPGGRVLATEFLWRKPPTPEARRIFLGELCPGMSFDTLEDWVRIYEEAGLDNVQVTSGPFEMMTPTGFLQDEGLANSLEIMGRALSRACYLKKMTWLMPRMNRAVPYLGYIAVSGAKPDQRSSPVHREADRGTTQTTISVETLRDLLDRDEPVTVLDIRRAEARAEWAIPESLHVDVYDALKSGDPDALADVDLPEDAPVVTVCNVGKTSAIAARQLRIRGFEALSLAGGMKAWSLAWNSAEEPVPGSDARIIQVRRTGKGCLSYVVGSKGEAAVIDAALDPEVYLNLANEHGWTISSVLETHVHADHLSRSRKLAELSGATLRLPDQDRVSYPFTPVQDGDALNIGTAKLAAMRTPGHTPESTCYLLDDRALFTGDTLFLGGVGRPDLEASSEETRTRAHALYRSLERILDLPPEILVLPGHTSEPVAFDGKPLAGTLAEVREGVEMLGTSEDAFVEAILARIPPAPPNHHRIVESNEAGLLPGGDPTDLEAGANRCAVS
jgi:glyoxylase-like metal-dependent hydrolase (beta-lactamase superfamily II)/SAM-dependent methyltransferase